jgi:hypothetical protein
MAGRVAREHVPDDHQDGVRDDDDRLPFGRRTAVVAPFHDVPVVEGSQVAGVADRGPGGLDQDRVQVSVAVPGLAGAPAAADSWLPEQIPAQEARRAALGADQRERRPGGDKPPRERRLRDGDPAPLSGTPVLCDQVEMFIDRALGICLRQVNSCHGHPVLRIELTGLTAKVDQAVFDYEPPPGMTVITGGLLAEAGQTQAGVAWQVATGVAGLALEIGRRWLNRSDQAEPDR